jgi:hypothetical protein
MAVTLAVVVWWATRATGEWEPRALTAFFAVTALAVLIEQRARIDVVAGVLVREGRLLGRVVWRWRHQLRDFTGIGLRRQSDPEGDDTVFVGLRRASGRLMAIQYFFVPAGAHSFEAEKMARSLADLTGLPLDEPSGTAGVS